MNEASPLVFTLETVAGPANFNWRVETEGDEIEVSVDLAGGSPLSTQLGPENPKGQIFGTVSGGGLEGQVTVASIERVEFSGIVAVRLDTILVAQGVSMGAQNLALGLFSAPAGDNPGQGSPEPEGQFPPPFQVGRVDLQGLQATGTFTWQAMRQGTQLQVLVGYNQLECQNVAVRPGSKTPLRAELPGFPPRKVPPGNVQGTLTTAALPSGRDLVRLTGEFRAGVGEQSVRGRFRGPLVLVPPPILP